MPTVEQKEEEGNNLLRILAYGKQKSKKTWWATAAAESNFNVLLLDGENGWGITSNLSSAAKKRVQVIDLQEQTKHAIFSPFLTTLLRQGNIVWDVKEQRTKTLQPNSDCVNINLMDRTANDILVIDSWTALVWSLQHRFALENMINLAAADKSDWDFYGWGGRLGTWIINQLKILPCHVIVVAHKTMYNKMTNKVEGKKQELLWSREQIASTSNPHAMTMGTMFSDILSFTRINDSVTKIDTSGNEFKEGGGRHIPPKLYNWEDLTFAECCKYANCNIPNESNPLWEIDYDDVKVKVIEADSKTNVINTGTNKINLNLKR